MRKLAWLERPATITEMLIFTAIVALILSFCAEQRRARRRYVPDFTEFAVDPITSDK